MKSDLKFDTSEFKDPLPYIKRGKENNIEIICRVIHAYFKDLISIGNNLEISRHQNIFMYE